MPDTCISAQHTSAAAALEDGLLEGTCKCGGWNAAAVQGVKQRHAPSTRPGGAVQEEWCVRHADAKQMRLDLFASAPPACQVLPLLCEKSATMRPLNVPGAVASVLTYGTCVHAASSAICC